MITGCDYAFPKIRVYNYVSTPIDVCGDYFGHGLIGNNPQDSTWHKKVRLNPGDSVNFYPWSWDYELDNLKITVEFDEVEKKDSVFIFDKNAMRALKEDSVIRIQQ